MAVGRTGVAAPADGIVAWTLKYVDKGLDDIEKDSPQSAEAGACALNTASPFQLHLNRHCCGSCGPGCGPVNSVSFSAPLVPSQLVKPLTL